MVENAFSIESAFYITVLGLPNTSILRILEKIQPSFMQYLLGLKHIQVILDYPYSDILYTIILCVNNKSWDNFPVGDQIPIICRKRVKPHKLLDYLLRKCRRLNIPTDPDMDAYPKFELTKTDSKIQQDYIINVLFITFVAYLETYSIKNFNQTLEFYNENENNCDPTVNKSYSVSDDFVKQYTSIVKYLQELLVILKEKNDDVPSNKLFELINDYFCN